MPDSNVINAIFAGIGLLLSAGTAAYISLKVGRQSAKKDEVGLLREEVERLGARVKTLENDKAELQDEVANLKADRLLLRVYVSQLASLLREKGIPVPPMPQLSEVQQQHSAADSVPPKVSGA